MLNVLTLASPGGAHPENFTLEIVTVIKTPCTCLTSPYQLLVYFQAFWHRFQFPLSYQENRRKTPRHHCKILNSALGAGIMAGR